MYELLKEFIKPELFILIPVLYLFGIALKRSQLRDKHIPWVLGAAGVALSLLFIAASSAMSDCQSVLMSVFAGITQGVLVAGASVYVNQLIKQAEKEE